RESDTVPPRATGPYRSGRPVCGRSHPSASIDACSARGPRSPGRLRSARRRTARACSRLRSVMCDTEMPLGHTASHWSAFEQAPKPSFSICSTMAWPPRATVPSRALLGSSGEEYLLLHADVSETRTELDACCRIDPVRIGQHAQEQCVQAHVIGGQVPLHEVRHGYSSSQIEQGSSRSSHAMSAACPSERPRII